MTGPVELDSDRPARIVRDGNVYWRASMIGGCERGLLAAAMPHKYPPRAWPDDFQVILDEGKRLEDRISDAWAEQTGEATRFAQKRIELYIGNINDVDVYIEGQIDGVALEARNLREFKKFRESSWQRFMQAGVEFTKYYPWQVSVYMHALTAEGGVPVGCECVGGRYDHEADRLVEVYGHRLIDPPIAMRAIRAKVARLENMIAQGFDPREGVCAADQFPCRWWYLHDLPDAPDSAAPVELADPEWEMVADWLVVSRAASEGRKEVKALEKRAGELRDGIIAALRARGIAPGDVALGDSGLVVHWKEQHRAEHVVKASTATTFKIDSPDEGFTK